jgi:hypothetical protein
MPDQKSDALIRAGKLICGGCMIHGVHGVERDPAFECPDCGTRFGDYWKRALKAPQPSGEDL